MTIAIGSASVIVNFIFLFFLRLIGILDPQWHFGSTLANQLALLYFARSVVVCVYILVFATSLPLRTAVGFSYMTYSRPQLQRVKLGHPYLLLPCNRPAKQKEKEKERTKEKKRKYRGGGEARTESCTNRMSTSRPPP